MVRELRGGESGGKLKKKREKRKAEWEKKVRHVEVWSGSGEEEKASAV